MRYNDFQDIKLSSLGFGTMRLPMDSEGNIDYIEGEKMVAEAFEGGITYFDTAYRYHQGESENFCGKVISKYPRDTYMLADKLPTWLCNTVEDAERIFAEQLEKCNVEYFDFYLLHNVDEEGWPNIEKLDLVSFMAKLKAEGRAKHIGFSAHCEPALLEEILSKYGDILEFVQLQINYFDWEYKEAKALYEIARKYNKPIIIMEPVRGGMLANLPSQEAKDILAEATKSVGKEPATGASYALRFVEQLEGVVCTLSGMSSLQQMKENIETFSSDTLTEVELEAIPVAASKLQADIIVPCTACDYCYECPAEIKISKIFAWYNEAAAKGFHWIWGSLSKEYEKLGPNATNCVECGNCEGHCPQKIGVIQKLKDIHKKYEALKEIGE